jgi:hypothetical protein
MFPETGAGSFSELQTVFGGTNPVTLHSVR